MGGRKHINASHDKGLVHISSVDSPEQREPRPRSPAPGIPLRPERPGRIGLLPCAAHTGRRGLFGEFTWGFAPGAPPQAVTSRAFSPYSEVPTTDFTDCTDNEAIRSTRFNEHRPWVFSALVSLHPCHPCHPWFSTLAFGFRPPCLRSPGARWPVCGGTSVVHLTLDPSTAPSPACGTLSRPTGEGLMRKGVLHAQVHGGGGGRG